MINVPVSGERYPKPDYKYVQAGIVAGTTQFFLLPAETVAHLFSWRFTFRCGFEAVFFMWADLAGIKEFLTCLLPTLADTMLRKTTKIYLYDMQIRISAMPGVDSKRFLNHFTYTV